MYRKFTPAVRGKYYVYLLIRPDTDEVFYVGKGKGMRVFDHEKDARLNIHSHKCNIIRKHGVRYAFTGVFDNETEAYATERKTIAAIGVARLTNKTNGGDGGGVIGRRLSDESKQKMSASKKGRPLTPEHKLKLRGRTPWNKGQPMSEDTRRKCSASKIGIKHGPHSEESKHKMSLAKKGKPKSEAHKQKIRTALLGVPLSPERRERLKGRAAWNEGKVGVQAHSAETKRKIGEASAARGPRSEETRRRQSIAIKKAFAEMSDARRAHMYAGHAAARQSKHMQHNSTGG
jgi:NUMOD3 motif